VNPEALVYALVALVVLVCVAWAAKWVIDTFLPPPVQMPARAIVGVILLLLMILWFLRTYPGALK
jgi:uncharacterized membrane protein YcjF (UPF0283 family)